jgi:hypothetical protein
MFIRNLQPDAWVAKGTFATVAGNTVSLNDFGFRRIDGHGWSSRFCLFLLIVDWQQGGKPALSVAKKKPPDH